MTEYRKGDVCSLEVVVQDVRLSGDHGVMLLDAAGNTHMPIVSPSDLTLIRRATVDLATCALPVEVEDNQGDVGRLVARHDGWGWVQYNNAPWDGAANNTLPLSDLRPADAPAPAAEAGEVERLREVATDALTSALAGVPGWKDEAKAALEALASTAPSCPPGHIMIGDRAVPEPMRSEPKDGDQYWYPGVGSLRLAFENFWDGDGFDQHRLRSGLIHSTEANARAHAEAIIALSAGEGV